MIEDPKDAASDEHEVARRERAYAMWERVGRPEDRHLEHWEAAGGEPGGTGGSDASRMDAEGPAGTPAGTSGERDARGSGEKAIPNAAPSNPNMERAKV